MDTTQEFIRYCNLLYHGRDVNEANSWLMELSQQESCWQILLPIIDDCEQSEVVLFFAVKLLHRCIQIRWQELDSADQGYILKLLAGKVFAPSNEIYTNILVQNQLSLSLSSIFCRVPFDQSEQLQQSIFSLDPCNSGVLASAVDILHGLPSEFCSLRARSGCDDPLAVTSFKFSMIYLFRRSVVLLEDQWQSSSSAVAFFHSINSVNVLRLSLHCLEALCGWCDASIGGVDKKDIRSWLEVEDLSSCAVEVVQSADSTDGACCGDNEVNISQDVWEGSVIHGLTTSMLPLLIALASVPYVDSIPPDTRNMAERCLNASLELMLSFLLSVSTVGDGDDPHLNECVAVSAIYECMTEVAARLFFRSQCISHDGNSLEMSQLLDIKQAIAHFSLGSFGAAVNGVQMISQNVIHYRLVEICGDEESALSSNLSMIALNFVECVMCVVDRHLVLLSEKAGAFDNMAAMLVIAIMLPYHDCALAVVEGLAVIISECSVSSARTSKCSGVTELDHARISFVMNWLLAPSTTAECSQWSDHFSGVVAFISCLFVQCRLPVCKLPPPVAMTLDPLQRVAEKDDLKGLVGFGSLASLSDDDDGYIDGMVEMRRECSHLLRALWQTVLEFDGGLAHLIAASVVESIEGIGTAIVHGDSDSLQSSRTLSEVLVFGVVSMQDHTLEALGLDEDESCEEDDEDCRSGGAKLTAIYNIDEDTLGKISKWVELISFMSNYILESLPAIHTPPELLQQYIHFWNAFPQFLEILAYRATSSEQISFYSLCMGKGLEVLRHAFGSYPRDVLDALESAATGCRYLVAHQALKFADWLLTYADSSDQCTFRGSSDPQLVSPLAYVDFYFFRVCGHFLKLSSSGNEGSAENKFQAVSYCTSIICSPILHFLEVAQSESDASSRAKLFFQARHQLTRSMLRLKGLAKAMEEDDVYMSFVPKICNSMFEVAHISAETYEWMRGRKLSGDADAEGIDVFIDTAHCHVGEGIVGQDQDILEMGKLVNGSIDLLCSMIDCQMPVTSPREVSACVISLIEKVSRIVEFVQSPKLVHLVTVLLRRGAHSDHDDIRDRFASLISKIMLHTQRKLDDPLLDLSTCDWLVEECNGCASMTRQIFISDANIMVYDISTIVGGQTIQSCVALNFINLTISLLRQDASLVETSPLTPRLFAAVFAKWESVAIRLVEDMDFRAPYQHAAVELLAALLGGIFYSSLAHKMKSWSELFHAVLSSLLRTNGDDETDCEIVYSICLRIFESPQCRHKCDQVNSSPVPFNAILAINDRNEFLLVGVEESASSIARYVIEDFQKSRRNHTTLILENLCKNYRIGNS